MLKSDGSYEVSLPNEDIISEGGEHVVTTAILMYILNHPEMMDQIEERMLGKAEEENIQVRSEEGGNKRHLSLVKK